MAHGDYVESRDSGFVGINEQVGRLVGTHLYQIRFGVAGAQLEFGDSFEFEVGIDTRLVITTADETWVGEPLSAECASALLGLVGTAVTSADVGADAALHLGMGDTTIDVWPNENYEAWQFNGPDGVLVVCPPGGESICAFGPRPSS